MEFLRPRCTSADHCLNLPMRNVIGLPWLWNSLFRKLL
jgi:hypothetical protein